MGRCIELLDDSLLPACQYYAYIEVSERAGPGETVVWQGYSQVGEQSPHFAMRRVSSPGEIFPVFHELFSGKGS